MSDTLLDKISKHPNFTHVTVWFSDQIGEIVDLKCDCVFRFVDYIICNGEPRKKHLTEESQLSCPIVACGFVGYWLHKKDSEGTKAIFDGYYELCLKNYEKAHECDDDAWERDLKKEFVCRHHVPTEKKWIKASEALFPYITESDQKKVKSIMANYLKYARSKRKQLYPPNHPANRIIEDTFLDAYRVGGPANECMSWMRTEYNLPCQWPHWSKDNKTAKELLSGRWKERHDKIIPEYIAEEYEDFDDRVLKYTNGGLMEEIDENLKNCQTQEDRIRYIISLLQPFKEFAEAFDAKARIDERKRSIKEHEKWIKDWEAMPDDAVDEQTGEPIRPKDQIVACNKFIDEYKKDIEYWKNVQQDFYWFAQHGLGAGDYRVYPQEVNDDMCKYLGGWWDCMIFFARRLAALALTYGVKLMDVQERCEIYLMWHFMITDYVDEKYITSTEHARKLLDEIDAKKPKNETSSKVEPSEKAGSKGADKNNPKIAEVTQKKDSDFEHLKTWQDNSNLDYYLSEEHWNFHVNQLLYEKLTRFYDGVSVGQYLNPPPNGIERFAQSIPNYSPLYGELFNEAYRLCSQVLTTPIPQTKIDQIAEQAAQIGLIRLFGLEIATKGMPGHNQPAPMVQDIIESYHILGMVNTILTFANDQQDAIDRFLIALSNHNDYNRYYAFEYHNFQRYNLMYQDLIVYTLNHETGLRPGYDYKKRKEYLRNKMSWFSIFENKYVKERQETESEKSTNTKEQNNYNSQVFNNCQVTINNLTATAEATDEKLRTGTQKKKCDRKQPPKGDTEKQHGVEYPVFKKGPGVTDYHIKALYLYLTTRNWISTQTKEVDFLRLFNGQDNDCEIIWTGQDKLGNNEPTPLGVSALYVLFKSMADEGYIMTSTKSNRVGPILESHFVDSNGHFLTSVSNVKTTSQTASTYIKKILATMQMRANQKFIQEKLNSDLSTLIEQEGEEKYNKYEY